MAKAIVALPSETLMKFDKLYVLLFRTMENSHPREKDEEERSDEEEHDDHHDISGAEVPPEFGEPVQKVMLQ